MNKGNILMFFVYKVCIIASYRTKWLYFWIGYVLSMLEFGLVFSFGALFPDMRDKFEIDRTTTVSVHSILIGTATCFCESI